MKTVITAVPLERYNLRLKQLHKAVDALILIKRQAKRKYYKKQSGVKTCRGIAQRAILELQKIELKIKI